MDYSLEPVTISSETGFPIRFKIFSKTDSSKYGWISKVKEKCNGIWTDKLLYGFYRGGKYFNKYPITFNVYSRITRSKMKHRLLANPRQKCYFRVVFGILDLEPEIDVLDFIFSWLYACKIQYV